MQRNGDADDAGAQNQDIAFHWRDHLHGLDIGWAAVLQAEEVRKKAVLF
jgi:hypothetical protein